MKRSIYLEELPRREALDRFFALLEESGALSCRGTEVIPVEASLGRVTAAPVHAAMSSPHYHGAAMDGFAVKAAATFGASEPAPGKLRLGQDAWPVDTGDPLPEGTDAVIMVEETYEVEPGVMEITAPAVPWQNVRPVGEDIVATEMILPARHRIRPVDIGGLMAGGVREVSVYIKPMVTLIPTGDEIVPPGAPLAPGSIIEFNSHVLGACLEQWGAVAVRREIVPDDWDRLKSALREALSGSDMVLLIAGSSAGREDYTADIIRELGRVAVHGVAIKPGKPVILGEALTKPVVGVPGYPVSASLALELFVKPLIYRWQGLEEPREEKVGAFLTRKTVSKLGVEEYVRVKLGQVGERMVATPLARGAGLISSLIRADGYLAIPPEMEGCQAGEEVLVTLTRALAEIEETTVVVGSHDIALDILSGHLRLHYPGAALSSAHVGSLGGILAVARGEAHMAGTHLLDEANGEYNIAYVERLMPGRPYVLVNLAHREQGLLVAPGNPLGIGGIEDLLRPGLRYVNRQRGAGTRVLLDYLLLKLGADPDQIEGYAREEMTHMAVAAAVAGGTADAGLGIRAAARALGLDFIPVARERYDLLVAGAYWDTPFVQRVLKVMADPSFQRDVCALGGYDLCDTGRIISSNMAIERL